MDPWIHGSRIHGSMDPWIHGSTDPWPWIHVSTDPWIQGSMDPGSMDPWINGSMDAWMHGSMDPWIWGSVDSGIHGSMDPWIRGSMDPRIHWIQGSPRGVCLGSPPKRTRTLQKMCYRFFTNVAQTKKTLVESRIGSEAEMRCDSPCRWQVF